MSGSTPNIHYMNEPYYDQTSRWSARQTVAQNSILPTQTDPSSSISQDQLIPAHIFRMFMPLGSWSDDEILVNALHGGERDGSTPKQTLEKLHGVNSYAAFMWKDYYLDHRSRIKFLVNKLRLSRNNSPIADPAPERASATVERQNSHIQPSSALSFLNHNISSERSTIDGLTARLAVGDSKPDIRILDGPSRSPSTSVSSTHERNIYTQKDSKYISWERSRKLAPKKVVALSPGSAKMKLDRQSAYQPESGTCGTTGDLDEDSADDELNMGMPGEKYTKADGRLLAKYIATVEDWKNKDDSERFENFHRRFPHRALTSWSRYYRRNNKELDKLSEKYKKCEKQLCLIPQVSHFVDSWPSSSTGMDSLPSALKRKFRVGDFAASNHGFAPKRTKYSIYNNSG